MKISSLFIALLTFSGAAFGLGTFFIETATIYSLPTTQLNEFKETFNQYVFVDSNMKAMQTAMTNIKWYDPLTWGNTLLLVSNLIGIIVSLPGMFQSIITDAVTSTAILPSWSTWFIEGMVLTVIMFAGVNLIRSSGDT